MKLTKYEMVCMYKQGRMFSSFVFFFFKKKESSLSLFLMGFEFSVYESAEKIIFMKMG